MAEILKSGTSIKDQELSRISIRITHSTFKAMVEVTTWPLVELIQDGGNSSEEKETSLSMLETEKFLMLKEDKIKKVRLFGFGEETMVHIKGGNLYISTRNPIQELRE